MSSSSQLVRTAYRRLLKAQQLAFAHDSRMQKHARSEIRRHFLHPLPVTLPPDLPADSEAARNAKLQAHLVQAEDAREFLLQNVIQAEQKQPGGRFVLNLQERHTVPDPPAKQ